MIGKTLKIDIPTTVKSEELVTKRRKQIAYAATKLFSQKGFHKTTMKELAREAGISEGAIYDYIQTKEEILLLNHQLFVDKATEMLTEAVERVDDPLEKLRRLVRTELKMMDRWADFVFMAYRESRSVPKKHLKMLLEKEREHLHIIEDVIEECIKNGKIIPCNVRLISNFIKVLIDTWVLKRWDLRGYADLSEVEASILNILFYGLARVNPSGAFSLTEPSPLEGKSAFVMNGGTLLGMAVLSFLALKGVRLAAYVESINRGSEYPPLPGAESKTIKFFSRSEHGAMNPDLFERVRKEMKNIDLYIHDIGIGNTDLDPLHADNRETGRGLDENLACAQEIAAALCEAPSGRAPSRWVYIAPWAWDGYANRIHYESVKGATVGLTKAMARAMASSGNTINCLVPGYIRAIRPTSVERAHAADLVDRIPMAFLGDINDITRAVGFIVSDASRYLTGHVFYLSGGED